MNKIVPFNKDIFFKTNLCEITSISLERTVSIKENNIDGEFILSGDYKINEDDVNKEDFEYKIPYDIKLDSKYDLSNIEVDISDFYYEIKDNKVLYIYIELKIDNLEERIIEEKEEIMEEIEELVPQRCIEEEVQNIFDDLEEKGEYATYKIYIVKEGDTIDSIISKYNVNKEMLDNYNDLNDIKLGDKIIIPTNVQGS